MDLVTANSAVTSIDAFAQMALTLSQSLISLGEALIFAKEKLLYLAGECSTLSSSLTRLSKFLESSKLCYSDGIYKEMARVMIQCANSYEKIDLLVKKLRWEGLRAKLTWTLKEKEIGEMIEGLQHLKRILATTLSNLQIDLELSQLHISSASLIEQSSPAPLQPQTLRLLAEVKKRAEFDSPSISSTPVNRACSMDLGPYAKDRSITPVTNTYDDRQEKIDVSVNDSRTVSPASSIRSFHTAVATQVCRSMSAEYIQEHFSPKALSSSVSEHVPNPDKIQTVFESAPQHHLAETAQDSFSESWLDEQMVDKNPQQHQKPLQPPLDIGKEKRARSLNAQRKFRKKLRERLRKERHRVIKESNSIAYDLKEDFSLKTEFGEHQPKFRKQSLELQSVASQQTSKVELIEAEVDGVIDNTNSSEQNEKSYPRRSRFPAAYLIGANDAVSHTANNSMWMNSELYNLSQKYNWHTLQTLFDIWRLENLVPQDLPVTDLLRKLVQSLDVPDSYDHQLQHIKNILITVEPVISLLGAHIPWLWLCTTIYTIQHKLDSHINALQLNEHFKLLTGMIARYTVMENLYARNIRLNLNSGYREYLLGFCKAYMGYLCTAIAQSQENGVVEKAVMNNMFEQVRIADQECRNFSINFGGDEGGEEELNNDALESSFQELSDKKEYDSANS